LGQENGHRVNRLDKSDIVRATVTTNAAQLSKLLVEYAKLARKDNKEVANKTALDVVFQALKETKKASTAAIKALEQQPWWPKYVSKRIMGKGVTFRKKSAKIHIQGKGFSEADAKEVSRKIIAARLRSVAFLKSGWIPAIKRLWPIVKDKPRANRNEGGARQYGQEKGSARPARDGAICVAEIINSANGIEKIGPEAAQKAIDFVAADRAAYISRKMQETARRAANQFRAGMNAFR
jgi:hypothetical protein